MDYWVYLVLILIALAGIERAIKSQNKSIDNTLKYTKTGNDDEGESKKCPACAEYIKIEAIKCRYCGETFDPEDVKRKIKEREKLYDENISYNRNREIDERKKYCEYCNSIFTDLEKNSLELSNRCPKCGMTLM